MKSFLIALLVLVALSFATCVSGNVPTICASTQKVCNYTPGESTCCSIGEMCIPNVGCQHVAAAKSNSLCPSVKKICDFAPGQQDCCSFKEVCVPSVGCQPAITAVVARGNITCSSVQKECDYAPNESECCIIGEECIPNVGCRCQNAGGC